MATGILASRFLGVRMPSENPDLWLIEKLLTFGACFGLAQWLALRRNFKTSWAWLASPLIGAAAFVAGTIAGLTVFAFHPSREVGLAICGAIAGTVIGGSLAALLRSELKQPWLAAASTALAGSLTATIWIDALGSPESPVTGAVGGAVYGVITGVGLLMARFGESAIDFLPTDSQGSPQT